MGVRVGRSDWAFGLGVRVGLSGLAFELGVRVGVVAGERTRITRTTPTLSLP